MRVMFSALLLIVSAMPVAAACVGSGSYQSCYDPQSGNSYSVQRYGNTTTMYGNNAKTGSSWSQQSTDFGNTTMHNGRDSRGNSWTTTCVNGVCN